MWVCDTKIEIYVFFFRYLGPFSFSRSILRPGISIIFPLSVNVRWYPLLAYGVSVIGVDSVYLFGMNVGHFWGDFCQAVQDSRHVGYWVRGYCLFWRTSMYFLSSWISQIACSPRRTISYPCPGRGIIGPQKFERFPSSQR